MTASDIRQYQRAKYLVRAYPGTPEGNTARLWLQARHEARMAQQGPPQTREERNQRTRERYHRNPKPVNERNMRNYFNLTPAQMDARRKRANARLRERWKTEEGFRPRKLAYQRSRTRQRQSGK